MGVGGEVGSGGGGGGVVMGMVGGWRRVIPSVMTIWTSYES